MRDLYCGDVNESHIGKEITLCGWVNRRRDLGAVIFLDLRDREDVCTLEKNLSTFFQSNV